MLDAIYKPLAETNLPVLPSVYVRALHILLREVEIKQMKQPLP